MKQKNLLIQAAVLLLLLGCDKEKIPLTGDREAFLVNNHTIKVDVTGPVSITLPAASTQEDWLQAGATAHHITHVPALSDTLTQVWSTSIGESHAEGLRLISPPIVSKGIVYTLDGQANLRAIKSETGATLWQKPLKTDEEEITATLGGGLALDGDIIYAVTAFGDVQAIHAETQNVIWKKELKTPVRGAPTLKDGRLYTVSVNNELLALDLKNGETLWTHTGISEQSALLAGASVAVWQNSVVVAYSSGEICCLQAENGHVIWQDILTPAARFDTVSTIPHVRARPIIDGESVYIMSYAGTMTAIDLKTGVRRWQKSIGGLRSPVLAGSWLFVQDTNGEIACVNAQTGNVHWATSLPNYIGDDKKSRVRWAGPLLAGTQLVFASSDGRICFVDAADGKLSDKTLTFDGEAFITPIVANGSLYLLTDAAQLYAWR